MDIYKAIEILHEFQKWRRGGKGPMQETKEIGQAIDLAIRVLRKVARRD